MIDSPRPTWLSVTLKTAVVHTVTYFAVGLVAFLAFDYAHRFEEPPLSSLMRPASELLVAAGPLFQPLRGILFGLVLWQLSASVFHRSHGWLVAWAVFAIVGIFGTFGPAPGSIEGLIYTKLPIRIQLTGLIEVVVQSLLLASVTCYWVNHPRAKWVTILLATLFVIVILLSALGVATRISS